MADQQVQKRQLPIWAEQLRQKYLAGEASVFVLHGNVFDRYLVGGVAYGMIEFLSNVLLKGNKDHVYEISLSRGVSVLQGGTDEAKAPLHLHLEEKGLAGIFESIERRLRDSKGKGNAVLFPYAGTIIPGGDSQFLSVDDRIAFTALHRWSLDDDLSSKDNVFILISESLAEINQAILTSPKVAAIEIPIPGEALREEAIRHYAQNIPVEQVKRLAEQTGGLRAIQLSSIVAHDNAKGLSEGDRIALIRSLLQDQPNAEDRAAKLALITGGMTADEIGHLVDPTKTLPVDGDPYAEMLELVRKRKRELIEKECGNLIEFVDPKHGLDAVGGNEHIKAELMEIAKAIKSGDKTRSPMGLLAVGAMGAGKTFVIKALLKESGLSGVVLKNFRSKWVGSTESNLERVLAAVKAMGPIAVIIDEGDRSFGKQSEDSDGGTSSRVIARLKEFMSDTENRGKVLFILMTNRPDKLDVDIKRPGRLDRKIPFFYAESGAERASIVKAILGRYDIECAVGGAEFEHLFEKLVGYSNADLEAVALLALEFAKRGDGVITQEIFKTAIADFMPPQDTTMIEFMNMLAVFETSRRSLLPAEFRDMPAADVHRRLTELRREIQD